MHGAGGGSCLLNTTTAVQAASSRSCATRRLILASSSSRCIGSPPWQCRQIDDVSLLGRALHVHLGAQQSNLLVDVVAHPRALFAKHLAEVFLQGINMPVDLAADDC